MTTKKVMNRIWNRWGGSTANWKCPWFSWSAPAFISPAEWWWNSCLHWAWNGGGLSGRGRWNSHDLTGYQSGGYLRVPGESRLGGPTAEPRSGVNS